MPVRSLNTSVIRWPDAAEVIASLRRWAEQTNRTHPEIVRVGYLGSYARGNWGVGSDLDVVLVVQSSEKPFIERSAAFDTNSLPVPVDLLVYTKDEFERLSGVGSLKAGDIRWLDDKG